MKLPTYETARRECDRLFSKGAGVAAYLRLLASLKPASSAKEIVLGLAQDYCSQRTLDSLQKRFNPRPKMFICRGRRLEDEFESLSEQVDRLSSLIH